MDKLILQNENKTLHINKGQALKIELKINLFHKKGDWIILGDILYSFHALNRKPDIPIKISNEKFNIIQKILTS